MVLPDGASDVSTGHTCTMCGHHTCSIEEPFLPVVCSGGMEWGVPACFASADRDGQRRFLRTLAPKTLVEHLNSKGIKVPVVSAAWQKMHKRWLGFWITEKCFLSGGPRPGGSSQQTARSAAIRKSRTRQTAFRNQLMRLDDVAHPTSVRQSTMTQFLQPPAAPPVQPAHQYHQQPISDI